MPAEIRPEPLVVGGLVHEYSGTRVLTEVNFTLGTGITALIGVNGAGKSTLMSAICGALRPGSGRISIYGSNPYGRGRARALRQVALMPQFASFPRNMTAAEVIEYLAWMKGCPSRTARERAAQALAQVGLSHRAGAKIGQLSGGMLRRVTLAQALASQAEVLVLDEPSTGLDPQQRREMVALIGQLTGTVLMSSHVLEDVVEVADRVLVLHEGKLHFDGSIAELTALAPAGSSPQKAAETGFLSIISSAR